MSGLYFPLVELEREIRSIKSLGRELLDPSRIWVLDRYLEELRSVGGASDAESYRVNLEGLLTMPSDGEYETKNRRGGEKIFAVIDGAWDIRPVGARRSGAREIEFCGIASTRIDLYSCSDPSASLAMWRLELGSHDSPGCYVHAQILGDSDEPPFPKSVPIPRLPSLFVTPMSAVEFALGELFLDRWAGMTAKNSAPAREWHALQKMRLTCLLSWYQRELNGSRSSPWMVLKAAKPERETFLPES